MDKALLIPLLIWAVMAVVTVLKKSLDATPKILAALPFLIYAFIFKDDIMRIIHLKTIPYKEIFKSSFEYAFVSLALLWPAALLLCQEMTDREFSKAIMKLAVFSAIVSAAFFYYN